MNECSVISVYYLKYAMIPLVSEGGNADVSFALCDDMSAMEFPLKNRQLTKLSFSNLLFRVTSCLYNDLAMETVRTPVDQPPRRRSLLQLPRCLNPATSRWDSRDGRLKAPGLLI